MIRPRGTARALVALAVTLSGPGCAGPAAHLDRALTPVEVRRFAFRRELTRARRDERHESWLEGSVTVAVPAAAGPREVTVDRARHLQREIVVRELDPALGAEPLAFEQRVDADGLGGLDAATRDLLGSELAMALELLPVGSCGILAREGQDLLALGLDATSGLPRHYPARCARSATAQAGISRWVCESDVERELELTGDARAAGITATLVLHARVDARIEIATALCLETRHDVTLEVVERRGDYEERQAGRLELVTLLEREEEREAAASSRDASVSRGSTARAGGVSQ